MERDPIKIDPNKIFKIHEVNLQAYPIYNEGRDESGGFSFRIKKKGSSPEDILSIVNEMGDLGWRVPSIGEARFLGIMRKIGVFDYYHENMLASPDFKDDIIMGYMALRNDKGSPLWDNLCQINFNSDRVIDSIEFTTFNFCMCFVKNIK